MGCVQLSEISSRVLYQCDNTISEKEIFPDRSGITALGGAGGVSAIGGGAVFFTKSNIQYFLPL